MSLLRDIQDAAIDSTIPIASLLRKCKVLAARLNNDALKSWVENELNGYDSRDSLPPYRVLKVNSKGHFSGPFRSGLRNGDIPLSCIDEKYRENLATSYLMEPVAALEALVENSNGATVMEPWNPDLVAFVGRQIYEGMNCMQAWKVIPITSVISAVDTVRTRVLNFALEIETEAPDAGEAPPNTDPVPQERVSQIFNTFISGEVQNVSTGGNQTTQIATKESVDADLFGRLLTDLAESGAEESEVSHVCGVVEGMRDASSPAEFKQRYHEFMAIIADHAQIYGPIVAPFMPAISAMLP